MPNLREKATQATAKELGFPGLDRCGGVELCGNVVAWIPGMKVSGTADYYFIVWHTGDIRRYQEAGGDMSRAVIHFLTHDAGVINPLWGKNSFHRRITQMRKLGIVNVVAPDFSSWSDFPVAVQLYNYYRSAVVASDLATAGFGVVPNVCWSVPSLHNVSIGMWEGCRHGAVLVDANHSSERRIDRSLFWSGADELARRWTNRRDHVFIWSSSQRASAMWSRRFGQNTWIPARCRMLSEMSKGRRRWRKAAAEAEEAALVVAEEGAVVRQGQPEVAAHPAVEAWRETNLG